MNTADQKLLNWINKEINTGKTKILVPVALLEPMTPKGVAEARHLEKLNGRELITNV